MEEGRQVTLGFGDRVARAVTERATQLVLGLDPDPAHLWPGAADVAAVDVTAADVAAVDVTAADVAAVDVTAAGVTAADNTSVDVTAAGVTAADDASADVTAADDTPSRSAERAASAVAAHCQLVLDAVADQCVAAKLQVACFERLGAPGWAALATVVGAARDHGLLVIADAKRGDIDVTATAYAEAFLGAGLDADALTVNPLLGRDSLAPFIAQARPANAGLFVLVRTSNPGAADIQDLALAGGGTVADRLAAMVTELGRDGVGEAGLSDVGAVVGATAPERLAALRDAMPQAIFLIPGVGAQGGRVEDVRSAFASGPAGGLISVSRGIVRAFEHDGGEPPEAARRAAERLREAAWAVAG